MPHPPAPWGQQPAWHVQPEIGEQEGMYRLALYNMMLPYMDPFTQWSMGNLLASKAPELFSDYASTIPQPGPMGQRAAGRYLDASRLEAALTALTPENLGQSIYPELPPERFSQAVPPSVDAKNLWQRYVSGRERLAPGRQGTIEAGQGPMFWLREYLQTAQAGMPTKGSHYGRPQRATSQQQALSAAHLQTMERQAQQDPDLMPYLTLAQNIVSPVLPKPPPSGLVGIGRTATSPEPGVTRAGKRRSPWLT